MHGWSLNLYLLSCIIDFQLTQEQDEFRQNLTSNGEFSVQSHYLALIHINVLNINKHLWKLKIPLKVMIFLWYFHCGVVLTMDNLTKGNWQSNKNGCFCHNDETIRHLFFLILPILFGPSSIWTSSTAQCSPYVWELSCWNS